VEVGITIILICFFRRRWW